jgi:hypothetical protein
MNVLFSDILDLPVLKLTTRLKGFLEHGLDSTLFVCFVDSNLDQENADFGEGLTGSDLCLGNSFLVAVIISNLFTVSNEFGFCSTTELSFEASFFYQENKFKFFAEVQDICITI